MSDLSAKKHDEKGANKGKYENHESTKRTKRKMRVRDTHRNLRLSFNNTLRLCKSYFGVPSGAECSQRLPFAFTRLEDSGLFC